MLSLSFSPLVPDHVLWALAGLAAAFVVLALVSRGPVAIVRALALALLLAALANPSLIQEDRERVKDIVAERGGEGTERGGVYAASRHQAPKDSETAPCGIHNENV